MAVRTILLGFAAALAVTASAHAQSVSALPDSAPPTQSARTVPYGSTQSFFPKAGGNDVWREPRYQAPGDYAANRADHPYSTSIGPSPGSHSASAERAYGAPALEGPVQHPYSAGMGPKPN